MKKLKVVIADDEIIMCEALKQELEKIPDVEIIGACNDGEEALVMVEKLNPDILFLDIRMPGLTGIEIAESLKSNVDSPAVVFVTAFDEFAFKGYEVDAIDYILKPFDQEDIERVIRKIRKIYSKSDSHEVKRKSLTPKKTSSNQPHKFCAYDGEVMVIVDSHLIQLFYAEGGEVFLRVASGEKYALKQTLQEIEQKLDNRLFFRCHRNYIVNMNFVKQITPWFNRGYLLSLKGDQSLEVPVSRSHIKALAEYIIF